MQFFRTCQAAKEAVLVGSCGGRRRKAQDGTSHFGGPSSRARDRQGPCVSRGWGPVSSVPLQPAATRSWPRRSEKGAIQSLVTSAGETAGCCTPCWRSAAVLSAGYSRHMLSAKMLYSARDGVYVNSTSPSDEQLILRRALLYLTLSISLTCSQACRYYLRKRRIDNRRSHRLVSLLRNRQFGSRHPARSLREPSLWVSRCKGSHQRGWSETSHQLSP